MNNLCIKIKTKYPHLDIPADVKTRGQVSCTCDLCHKSFSTTAHNLRWSSLPSVQCPSCKRRRPEQAKEMWSRPEYREARHQALKKSWDDNRESWVAGIRESHLKQKEKYGGLWGGKLKHTWLQNNYQKILSKYPYLNDQLDLLLIRSDYHAQKVSLRCPKCGADYQIRAFPALRFKIEGKSPDMCQSCALSKSLSDNWISKFNRKFADSIYSRTGLQPEFEYHLGGFSYDMKVGENLLIDINPTISHSSTKNFRQILGVRGNSIVHPSSYHLNRWKVAVENGFELISIFDWDNKSKVLDLITHKLGVATYRVFARKCEIVEVSLSDARLFFNHNHIMGWDHASVVYGLSYEDTIVAMMCFGKPRISKQFDWELLRFCTLSDWSVVGGASRLFKHFVRQKNPLSCVTFSSNNYGTGSVYSTLGFSCHELSRPSLVWHNIKTKHIIRNSRILRQGADSYLKHYVPNYFHVGMDYDSFISRGGKEEYAREYEAHSDDPTWWPGNSDILKHYGYLEVYDSGNTRWEWYPQLT